MTTNKHLLFSLFFLIALMVTTSVANAAPPAQVSTLDGVLRGKVINATTNQPVADLRLILHAISAAGETGQTYTATSTADGSFVFNKLSREHTLTYGLEAVYLGVNYFSPQPAVFLPNAAETELNLNVYETTTDPAAISQSTLHRIVNFAPNQISLADVYVFSNSGNRAYVGQPNATGITETVKISLPAAAEAISFRDAVLVPSPEGDYSDHRPIPPGEGSLVLFATYELPFSGSQLTVETGLHYDVSTVNVLAVDQGETVTGDQLESQGVQSMQGIPYQLLSGQNFKADQLWVMTFGNLDQLDLTDAAMGGPTAEATADRPATTPDQNLLRWILLGVGAAVIAFGGLYGSRSPSPVTQTAGQELLRREQTVLLTRLAELEQLYQAGTVEESVYQGLKQQDRARLKKVLAQLYD